MFSKGLKMKLGLHIVKENGRRLNLPAVYIHMKILVLLLVQVN